LIYARWDANVNAYSIQQEYGEAALRSLVDLDIELLRDFSHPFWELDDSAWWFDE